MSTLRPNPTIVKTSPPKDPSVSLHPRRPPAQRSVSLRHSHTPSKQPSTSSSDGAEASSHTNSPSSLIPLHGKNSSGESSNAEKWFEKSNNDVRDPSAGFDNEPPFFMRNSSSETPPDGMPRARADMDMDRANSLPFRTGLLRLGTEGSSTEDFRSVIDDLTVQNKKLKRKLKKYEKLQDSHLKDEKLFEVRIHGLAPEKKRELEETLRKFAAGLDTSGQNAFPPNGYASLMPLLKTHKTASSQTSIQNTDSAYASMSASGQGSSGQSGSGAKHSMTPRTHLASRSQNIHNYLHHIPEGLMPQQNPATLSERAKKKIVVRRMEQLFAGKGAAAVSHQQSLQQQEVSQIAAKADRSAIEASGQRARQEGKREARIMQRETEDPLDMRQDKRAVLAAADATHQTQRTGAGTPGQEQRPTRPLDLDPHRAQVPAENIQYMRHLGFSPPDPSSTSSPEQDHGWIYLNFLINMAQLHTLNVTADFVRKALGEFSDQFEISSDLRKVRWRGGVSVTRTSSSGGGSSNDRVGDDTPDGRSPAKRPKLSHQTSARSHGPGLGSRAASQRRRQAESSKHVYTPLFFHRDSTDDTDDSSSEAGDDAMSSPFPAQAAGDSSGMTSSGIRTSSGVPMQAPKKQKHKHDDGPIIFYNNARFCTDLSGDRMAAQNNNRAPVYIPASAIPIGKQLNPNDIVAEKRGPLSNAAQLPEPMELGDNPIPESMELSFPQRSPMEDSSPEQKPIDLEVTGIGGVWPTDNFAISVQSRHALIDQAEAPSVANDSASKKLPPRIARVLQGSDAKSRVRSAAHKQYLATEVQQLPPSRLPEALSFFPCDEDSVNGDDDSDADEEMSDAPESLGDLPPSAAPQPVELPYASEDEAYESDDEEDEESDGEVDFLAAARAIDPEAVRQREREYDANMAERLAEEIPAGSSAATAGGGSGFASPATGVTQEEHIRASREARVKAANMSRARTHAVHKMQDASDSEDDAEMSDIGS